MTDINDAQRRALTALVALTVVPDSRPVTPGGWTAQEVAMVSGDDTWDTEQALEALAKTVLARRTRDHDEGFSSDPEGVYVPTEDGVYKVLARV